MCVCECRYLGVTRALLKFKLQILKIYKDISLLLTLGQKTLRLQNFREFLEFVAISKSMYLVSLSCSFLACHLPSVPYSVFLSNMFLLDTFLTTYFQTMYLLAMHFDIASCQVAYCSIGRVFVYWKTCMCCGKACLLIVLKLFVMPLLSLGLDVRVLRLYNFKLFNDCFMNLSYQKN